MPDFYNFSPVERPVDMSPQEVTAKLAQLFPASENPNTVPPLKVSQPVPAAAPVASDVPNQSPRDNAEAEGRTLPKVGSLPPPIVPARQVTTAADRRFSVEAP